MVDKYMNISPHYCTKTNQSMMKRSLWEPPLSKAC